MKNSSILWCDHTWNVATGCHKASDECVNCYMYRNSDGGLRYNPAVVNLATGEMLLKPDGAEYRSKKLMNGSRPLIFTSSQTDLFLEELDEIRPQIWDTIKRNNDLIFLILTKRPERIIAHLPEDWNGGYENVWLGVSVGKTSNLFKITELLAIPSAHYFLSAEPLLEEMDLRPYLKKNWRLNSDGSNYLDWVIVGGETGYENSRYGYRECNIEWIESIVEQCIDSEVPVFVKQLGSFLGRNLDQDKDGHEILNFPDTIQFREFPMFDIKRTVETKIQIDLANPINIVPADRFWDIDGKIDTALMLEFLTEKGIGLYYSENDEQNSTPILIHETNNIVSLVNEEYIKRLVKDYIIVKSKEDGIYSNKILNSLIKSNILKMNYLHFLSVRSINFIEDTRNVVHFFFKNGVIKITNNEVQLLPYENIDGSVWKTDIILKDISIEDYHDFRNAEFLDFICDLANCDNQEQHSARIDSLVTIIGYLLSRYKDPSLTKAIILMDSKINGVANGGSGKSLLSKAIGNVREMACIDGKFYDARRAFNFDLVKPTTKTMLFDDVEKGFDFEKLFPIVTTGIKSEKKHKDSIYISYARSPKILITTNYAIEGSSESFLRRVLEFEVSHIYNSTNNPEKKFGHLFFEGWDANEFNKFYNVMFYCSMKFLSDGLVVSESINLERSKLICATNEDFIEWADLFININKKYDKRSLFEKFKSDYPDFKHLKQKTFTDWLRRYAEFKKFRVIEMHSDTTRSILFAA